MINWRKSSRSGGGGAGGQECVEVAQLPGLIGLRDSKHPETGNIAVCAQAFARLISDIKRDSLSLR